MGLNETMARLKAEHAQAEIKKGTLQAQREPKLAEMRKEPKRWKTEREQVIGRLEKLKPIFDQNVANVAILENKVASYTATLEGAKRGVEKYKAKIAELTERLKLIEIVLNEQKQTK